MNTQTWDNAQNGRALLVTAPAMVRTLEGGSNVAQVTCSVAGCERPAHARVLCGMHYQRWKAHGDGAYQHPPAETRFWPKVDRSGGPDACWPWLGCRNPDGYGQFYWAGRMRGAYRFALELRLGRRLGPDEVSRHQCHNPPCVNPAHLVPGTTADNNRDMILAGRANMRGARGEDNGRSILTETDVRYIRQTREPRRALAARYGVSLSAIKAVRRGQNWRHVA